MNEPQILSQQGIELITSYEGCSLKAYLDSANKYTIGYGHTSGVKAGDIISHEQAIEYLKKDIKRFENHINQYEFGLTQGQFDALVCFAYNIGSLSIKIKNALRDYHYVEVTEKILNYHHYTKNGEKKDLLGLQRRRLAEAILFTGFQVNKAVLADIRHRITAEEIKTFSYNLIERYKKK